MADRLNAHGFQVVRRIRARDRAARNSPVADRHPSTLHFRCVNEATGQPACVKVVDVSTPQFARFYETEVDQLNRLSAVRHHIFGELAPRLQLADAENGLIVMDWLDGKPLKHALMHNRLWPTAQDGQVGDAGSWLRSFHAANGITRRPMLARKFLKEIRNDIEMVATLHGLGEFTDVLSRQASGQLLETAARLDEQVVPVSLRHTDFTPSNLMVQADGKLRGFDFGRAASHAPVTFDMAQFIVRARDQRFDLPPGSNAMARTLDAMLAGYNGADRIVEREPLAWCVLLAATQRYVRLLIQAKAGVPSGLFRRGKLMLEMRSLRHAVLQAMHLTD